MMKNLLSNFKTLFVAICLLGGGVNSAWATDVPYSIGSYSDGYRGSYSDPYTLETGQTLHLTFVNNNNGTANGWNNFILEATSAVDKHDGVYFDMRADNYAFGAGTFVQNYNGNQKSNLDGATVDMDVTYAGGIITVEGIYTKAEVTTYHSKYTYSVAGSPASVVIYLTEEAAVLNITKAEISSWTTVWSTDFSSAPSGMTYSTSSGGNVNITNGYLTFDQYSGSGSRSTYASFTADAFNVETNWIMEFDWNGSGGNTADNDSKSIFASDQGTVFTATWPAYASTATITDANGETVSSTLPVLAYANRAQGMTSSSHFVVKAVKDDGIYLTVTYNGVAYVKNVKVSSTFGYPKTFNGTVGKNLGRWYLDNILFMTPTVVGFVATPTYTITAPDGTNRKFTLDCVTDGATIYYATSNLEKGAAGWLTYSSEVSTDATTIYTYAQKGSDTSDKTSFATGAGKAITLNAPTINLSGIAATAGLYYPVVTISSDQSDLSIVPASPTLTYKFNGSSIPSSSPYTFTATGTLNVTVSADGYTSNSANYVVSNGFIKTNTIDLATITEGDLSAVWTKTSDAAQLPDTRWLGYSSEEFPLYVYDYRSGSASNTAVIDGLTVYISNADTDPGVTPTLYVGAGMILPTKKLVKADLSESDKWNSNIGVKVTDGRADQIAVYTYPTNYGSSTSTKTIAANENFGLYRYSDMLTQVEVYSPVVTKPITAAGWATYCSTYALDLEHATGLTDAYIVTGGADEVLAKTSVKDGTVPANTGLLLKAPEGTVTIPVVASSSTDVSANKLIGVTANTEIAANAGWVLMASGTYGLGFYQNSNAFTVGANTAYLPADFDETSARGFFSLEGDVTGISTMHNSQFIMHNDVYDLQGRRVAAPTKGLYIVNGKKVVIK